MEDLSRYQPAGVSDEELMQDFFVVAASQSSIRS